MGDKLNFGCGANNFFIFFTMGVLSRTGTLITKHTFKDQGWAAV